MNIYIANNHNRKEYLVANSIHKEYNWILNSFHIQDIYEIAFNKNGKVVIVLDETKLQLPEIAQFIQDFIVADQTKTKLVLLGSDAKINHKNIFCLPSTVYKPYDEYYQPTKVSDSQFILCHLDITNHKTNAVIQDIVYPNNKDIPIRLVGHPGIQHIQNVGLVTDSQMLDLIYSCVAYINISNEYIYEAILYNKPILSIIDNEYIKAVDKLQLEDLHKLIDTDNTIDYQHNLKQHKISNIIKSIVKL